MVHGLPFGLFDGTKQCGAVSTECPAWAAGVRAEGGTGHRGAGRGGARGHEVTQGRPHSQVPARWHSWRECALGGNSVTLAGWLRWGDGRNQNWAAFVSQAFAD